jgi:hypothetical protein
LSGIMFILLFPLPESRIPGHGPHLAGFEAPSSNRA